MPKVAIFDYGAGNLFSLESSIRKNGAKQVSIIRDMDNLDEFDGLVLRSEERRVGKECRL